MAVLAVLIAVNVVLLFLLFRPDRALTAQPADQDPVDSGCLRRHQLLPVPAPRQIRRPRPDQSSRLLSNGCSSPRLPRRLGGRLLATATPPARLSGRLTAALAGNESYEPVRHRSCSSAPSQAAMCSPLAVRVRAAHTATWRTPMTAQSQPPPTALSTCGSPLRATATKSMGPATRKPPPVRGTSSALPHSTYLELWSFAITAPRLAPEIQAGHGGRWHGSPTRSPSPLRAVGIGSQEPRRVATA